MVKRTYIPGQEWLYLKVYCGFKTADDIVVKIILPISKQLTIEKKISKWFFIRYSDPENHIRLRLNLTSNIFFNEVVQRINSEIEKLIKHQIIWKVTIDTYFRELERYRPELIDYAEDIFHYDSLCCAEFIESLTCNDKELKRWKFAFISIDLFLSNFGYSLSKKFELMGMLKGSFYQEFSIEKVSKISLDKKYRQVSDIIHSILTNEANLCNEFLKTITFLNSRSSYCIKPIYAIKTSLNNNFSEINRLVISYIHMSLNRLFRTKQRLHELVIYDFLWRYYRSELAKSFPRNAIEKIG